MKPTIPIFFHIPKCAGTYVTGCMHSLFRQHYRNHLDANEQQDNRQLQRLTVDIPNHGLLTIFAFTPAKYYNDASLMTKIDDYASRVSVFKLFSLVKNLEIEIFSIIIEPDFYWGDIKNLIDLRPSFDAAYALCDIANSNYKCFGTLRSPFQRVLSAYAYLCEESSSHEPNHKKIMCESLKGYIMSDQLEDSWVIRSLSGKPYSQALEQSDFDYVINFLKDFTFTLNAEDSINDVFKKSYNINLKDCEFIEANRNQNPDKQNLKLNDLDQETQNKYKNVTQFDYALYKHFIKS